MVQKNRRPRPSDGRRADRRAADGQAFSDRGKPRPETARPAFTDERPRPAQIETLPLPPAVTAHVGKRIAVVGGGAAGMAAALTAAGTLAGAGCADVQVLLLEKGARVGRKLLATGNGRCNLSHTDIAARHYVSRDAAALADFMAARSAVDAAGAAGWLESLGLLCRAEGDGRLYPYCGQASMVLDVLRDALEKAGVVTMCEAPVRTVRRAANGFEIGLQAGDGQPPVTLMADRLILAAGGAAAPALGGGRDGYALAAALGHSCTALHPALVGLRCSMQPAAGNLAALKGIRAMAAVTLYDGTQPVYSDAGEVQFNEDGLSGIPVMQASLRLAELSRPALSLDLLPQMDAAALYRLLSQRAADCTQRTLLLGTVHKRLAAAVQKAAGIPLADAPAAALPDAALKRLADTLKDWRFAVEGTQGWAAAQVTVGGVPLTEVAATDCASKRCAGLYLAGELLDAAGACGGYNLDWAFTTGGRAGAAAAAALMGVTQT